MCRMTLALLAAVLSAAVCQPCHGLDSYAEAGTRQPDFSEDRPKPVTVTLPIPPWDAPVPTGEIQVQAGVQLNNGPIRDQIKTYDQTRKPKYTVSSVGEDFMVTLIPGQDIQSVPESPITGWDGVNVGASGAWFTKEQTVPLSPSPDTRVEVSMSAVSFVSPFDPRAEIWYGFAISNVRDPISVPVLDDRSWVNVETFVPMGLKLAAAGTGVATHQLFAGTDLPGYETLYQLDVEARDVGGTATLDVDFTSHAMLGLDNQAVIDAVRSAFVSDPAASSFELMSDVPLFSGDLALPSGTAFNLYFDLTTTAEASQGEITGPPTGGPAAILSPVAVLGSDLGEYVSCTGCGIPSDTPFENMINQSGIEPFDSGVTPFDDYILSAAPADGNYLNNWQSELLSSGAGGGYIDFDLGEVWFVDRMAIWNEKLDQIAIQIADTPDGPWQTVGEFQLDPKPGVNVSIAPEVLLLDQAYDTRYLRIDVRSVQPMGGPYGSDIFYATVGEVALGVRPIPEPGSAALLVAGAFIAAWYPAFMRRRIRGS